MTPFTEFPTEGYLKLMEHGVLFSPVRSYKDHPKIAALAKLHKATAMKECWGNCQLIASFADPADKIEYYEGYVFDNLGGRHQMLIHHGWLVVDGVAYDPTLGEKVEAFGMSFTKDKFGDCGEFMLNLLGVL